MLETWIETGLILRQPDILPDSHQQIQPKWRDFNVYVSLLFCLHAYA